MNEMINATTSLMPVLTLTGTGNIYYQISIFFFSIIATVNHLFPENFAGTTHLVKLLVTNILFSVLEINPIIGFSLSLIDLSPLYLKNKNLIKAGELFLQIPRQIIDFYLVYKITVIDGYSLRGCFIIISKVVYYMERRLRIKRGERNNFYFFHCFEHLGLYTLLCTLTSTYLFNLIGFLKMFICFFFYLAFLAIILS